MNGEQKGAVKTIEKHLREGRFGRTLALITAASSLVSGLEVGYEHYKGSYSQNVMYTPIILSGALGGAALIGFVSEKGARWVLRPVAALTMVDGLAGFGFHILGVARKPGGWRIPVTNIVMGPPLFAPLLFTVPAYLGLIAASSPREGQTTKAPPDKSLRKNLAAATALASALCGAESWFSHYKSRFTPKSQWIPVVVGPLLAGVSLAAIGNRKVARTLLPALSLIACATGGLGTYFHVRGIARRPGGLKHWIYNCLYGPPVFAPMLFGAAGMMGILASQVDP